MEKFCRFAENIVSVSASASFEFGMHNVHCFSKCIMETCVFFPFSSVVRRLEFISQVTSSIGSCSLCMVYMGHQNAHTSLGLLVSSGTFTLYAPFLAISKFQLVGATSFGRQFNVC